MNQLTPTHSAFDSDLGWVPVAIVNSEPDVNGDIVITNCVGGGCVLFPQNLVKPLET
jgi:hypothetical protein